jgi:hypothetical protein
MKWTKKLTLASLAAFVLTALTPVRASDLLYSQAVDGQSIFGPSEVWAPSSINSEVADDFDIIGNISDVTADGVIKNPDVSLVKSKKGTVFP